MQINSSLSHSLSATAGEKERVMEAKEEQREEEKDLWDEEKCELERRETGGKRTGRRKKRKRHPANESLLF